MFLWVLFLHNYIIPQKRLLPCFFRDAAFSFVFYSANDEKYYMRVFRKFEGMTPAQYRSAIGVK